MHFINTFRHEERYDAGAYTAAINRYDDTIMDYWKTLCRNDGNCSRNLANSCQKVYYPQVKPVACHAGIVER